MTEFLEFLKTYKSLCPTGFRKCPTEFYFFRTSCPTGFEKSFAVLHNSLCDVLFPSCPTGFEKLFAALHIGRQKASGYL